MFATMSLKSSFLGALSVAVSLGGVLCSERQASAAGFEVFIRPAYGAAGGASPVEYTPNPGVVVSSPPDDIWKGAASPYGGGLLFQGGLGVRLGPVSVGLDGGIRNASATSPNPNIQDLSRSSWNAGPYVHVYIPGIPLIDPWVGLGVQYVADTQTYKIPTPVGNQTVVADWRLAHHGVAVPLTLGVDYKILGGLLAVGPSFQYSMVFPAGGCAKVSAQGFAGNNFCASEEENKKITTAKGYGVWSLGLTVRLTFPPS